MPSFAGRIEGGQVLLNVLVSAPNAGDDDDSGTNGYTAYRALLDTGATISGISEKIAAELKLIPDGWRPTAGIHGVKDTPTCSVAMHIAISEKNSEGQTIHMRSYEKMSVTLLAFQPKNFDVLLGMDILQSCHFSMSNGMFMLSV